jgi:hypothetical protein
MYPPVIQFETRKREIEQQLRLLESRRFHVAAAEAARRERPAQPRPFSILQRRSLEADLA